MWSVSASAVERRNPGPGRLASRSAGKRRRKWSERERPGYGLALCGMWQHAATDRPGTAEQAAPTTADITDVALPFRYGTRPNATTTGVDE